MIISKTQVWDKAKKKYIKIKKITEKYYTKEELKELREIHQKNKNLKITKVGLHKNGKLIHRFKYYGDIPYIFVKT